MTSSPRRARTLWGDARFFIGIALVAVSVASVWLIVSSARETAPVLQATRTIVVGEVLSSADFRTVDVGLGALGDSYLTPGELGPGLVATRTVDEGELMPQAAAGPASEALTTTVVIDSAAGISESLATGTVVELWYAPPSEEGRGYETPRVLVPAATVAVVVEARGMVAQGGATLELVIDRAEVAEVLAAITDGSALSVVPVGSGS